MSTSTFECCAPARIARCVAHCIVLTVAAPALAVAGSFVAFESGPVRPLAMSADGLHLYAVNIPDNRLEIFEVNDAGLTHFASVPVGMEPVAVAARGNDEAWVVNHLSDSISIVRLSPAVGPRVAHTLFVGDEPRDIQFAGPGNNRAFITAANRNLPRNARDAERNADIWVFDAEDLGDEEAGGSPIAIVNLYADVPRALAVSPDGSTVYAAVFNSGNQTTVMGNDVVNGDLPPPLTNAEGALAPATGLIVRFDGTDWLDAAGRPWTAFQNFTLPDADVFALDATTSPPRKTAVYSGVGTVNFNMVANPVSGKLYVSNLEARNDVRFEGTGEFGGSTVRGHFMENRITVIDETGVHPRHLNKHIDYDVFPGTRIENARSLALPLQMVLSADGKRLYTVAFGSSKVAMFNATALENDTFKANTNHIELSGGGPCGLVLDEPRNRLYVLTRFDNSLVIVDLAKRSQEARLPLYNPEPVSLTEGRRFLYDARYTSSHGDSACASCHIFGDQDGLAWDLGNPDGAVLQNPNPFAGIPPGEQTPFHPMKGPMTTQSLRGLANHGPMHWRGDRTGGAVPGGDPLDEMAAFEAFNGAFEGLLGRTASLTDEEMHAFADFALQLTYPPNPIRALDNSLTAAQERGRDYFFNFPSRPQSTCEGCHTLDPARGFFGTQGLSTNEVPDMPMKIPHLRNLYTKEGITSQPAPVVGPQIRGFGFTHDGNDETLFAFFNRLPFDFPGGDAQRMDLVSFMLAFDSDLAPIVGRQVTVTHSNGIAARDPVGLMVERAGVTEPRPECDLIAKGLWQGLARGWTLGSDSYFHSDRIGEPALRLRALWNIATKRGQELTFTCVPPGSGIRMGLDRDEDGYYDRDELDAGSDPADPGDTP